MSQTPKRLVLMRHAKSSWDHHGIQDHDRPLNQRGRLAASLMGAWLADQDWRLDLALISSSARTQESWARIAPMLPAPVESDVRADLYHAEPETLLQTVQAIPESAGCALIRAHNPGLETFLSLLESPRGGFRQPRRMPTAATAVLTLPGAWRDASYGAATLEAFEQPKTLV